jgi:hypothetical protein
MWAWFVAVLLGLGLPAPARSATCTAEDFAAAVDRSGASLRAFNAEALPKLRAKLKELKDKKGWDEADYEEKGLASIGDKHSEKLDTEAEDLILKIDTLGRPPAEGPPDCTKLAELDAAGLELLAVMKAKSTLTLSRLDAAIAGKEAAPKKQAAAPPPKPAPKEAARSWDTKTEAQLSPAAEPPVVAAPLPLPAPAGEQQAGYTITEIQEITRGFFGTISTSLASVLEYAFATSGRPDGYVLGKEGGGAFLAGVRYGSGTLYMRTGGTEKIYWHGPSIGTDVGAAGSRTMFLIYNLKQPADLMRGFTGVDGSAYFVGGIGVNYQERDNVVLAPMRAGVGLRLGANIGYLAYSRRRRINPF